MTDPATQQPKQLGFGRWLSSLWAYTLLRILLFLALWGILLLVGLEAFFAGLLAAVLSVPLSLVLLARPRNRMTANINARLEAQRVRREGLDQELDPDQDEREAAALDELAQAGHAADVDVRSVEESGKPDEG